MSGKLDGRTAVITGSSKGMGKAMALALAQEGARVALVSRDENLLQTVREAIAGAGGQASVFAADVSNEDDVRGIEREIVAQFEKVNILLQALPL